MVRTRTGRVGVQVPRHSPNGRDVGSVPILRFEGGEISWKRCEKLVNTGRYGKWEILLTRESSNTSTGHLMFKNDEAGRFGPTVKILQGRIQSRVGLWTSPDKHTDHKRESGGICAKKY